MSSISEFLRMFKDSLCRESSTNVAKKSAKMWTTNLCKSLSNGTLLYLNSRLLKIRSVHGITQTVNLVESVTMKVCMNGNFLFYKVPICLYPAYVSVSCQLNPFFLFKFLILTSFSLPFHMRSVISNSNAQVP